MRAGHLLLSAALAAAVLTAPLAAQREIPRRLAVDSLISDAESIAPEFSAEALIRITALAPLERRRQRRLLDEAFARAYSARDDHRLGSSLALSPDSRPGALGFAYAASLNRVSLQVRAAQMMASIDPAHAREMFEWIDLHTEVAGCDALLVPIVDEYYSALGVLARTAFRNRAEGLQFLELYLWRARLPSEMPAIARAVLRFRPAREEAAYLETALGWILANAAVDPRGFSNASLDLVSRIGDLQKADRERGLTGWHLMEALRGYLIAQLSGPRCSDSVIEPLTAPAFNGVLTRLGADEDVTPIDGRALRPSKMLAAAKIDWYWQTSETRRLHEDWLQLRGQDRSPVPMAVRQAADWRNRAERFLATVEQWPGTRENERDYLYQKGMLLTELIDFMPPSPVRLRAMHAFVEVMRHADGDRNLRALWFALLMRYLESSRGPERPEMLQVLEDSNHPVMSIFARLERRGGPQQISR